MNAIRDREASKLRGTLAGASSAVTVVLDTAERLSAMTVGALLATAGGSAGLLLAFAGGVAAPAFASGYVLLGGFTLGGSLGAFVSRYVGPAALRHRREAVLNEIELRRAAARALTETMQDLGQKPSAELGRQLNAEIAKTLSLSDLHTRAPVLSLSRAEVASAEALPRPASDEI